MQWLKFNFKLHCERSVASSIWCRAPNWAHNQILISLFDSYFVFSVQGSLTHIPHEQSDPAQSHVSEGRNFEVTIGRAAWEACSATWNLSTNSTFALGPRKTTENLYRVGRSQDLPDANWLLASSSALTLVPICAALFLFSVFLLFFISFFFITIVCMCDRHCGLVVEFLTTDPEARVRFPVLPGKKSSGSGTGSTQPREYNWGATW
jgi:hypothetical protein